MAGSDKEVDKKLNISTESGDLAPAKDSKGDEAGKSNGLLDELDSKLDDFFTLDGKETKAPEKRQIIKSPLDDLKAKSDAPEKVDPDKDKRTIKTTASAPPAPPKKKAAVSSAARKIIPAANVPRETKVQKSKEAAPAVKKSPPAPAAPKKPEIESAGKNVSDQAQQKTFKLGAFKPVHPDEIAAAKPKTGIGKPSKTEAVDKLKPKAGLPDNLQKKEQKPADKSVVGKAQIEKPIISKTKSDPTPKKAPPAKVSKAQTPPRPVESKKTDRKQGKKKLSLLKLTLYAVILAGGVLALLTFFQSPDSSRQSQTVAAPATHKIMVLPTKAPETKPAAVVAPSMPQPPEPAVNQPEVPPAAATAEKKITAPPVTPAINPIDEIKSFLQEWKAAWEKSAGKDGDTDAFMSFYSDDFNSNGFDKNKWRQDKADKNRRKKWIRIKLDKINILGPLKNGLYEARFIQIYESSNYADTSDQILIIRKEATGWKIISNTAQQTLAAYPFSIHDGSFRTLGPAREAAAAYRKMGLEAYWTSVDLGEKGTWYRVFIGYYATPEAARRIIAAKSLSDASPEETRYASLVGTYASEDDLQSQRRLVAESGFSPYVIMDDNGNLNLYVGAHNTSKNAAKVSAELSARGIPSRVVER